MGRRSLLAAALWSLCLLASCFRPLSRCEISCSKDQDCPSGLSCLPGDLGNLCGNKTLDITCRTKDAASDPVSISDTSDVPPDSNADTGPHSTPADGPDGGPDGDGGDGPDSGGGGGANGAGGSIGGSGGGTGGSGAGIVVGGIKAAYRRQ